MSAPARQHSLRSAAFAEAVCRFVISRSRTRNRCGWPAALPAPKSTERGEKAATPGQPAALARGLDVSPGNSLSRITGCRWLRRIHPAKSGLSRFAAPTLCQIVAPSQYKKCLPLCRNCGRQDFFVEERGNLSRNFSARNGLLSDSITYTALRNTQKYILNYIVS